MSGIRNGYVHDCHHKIELTKTVILKKKLAPNSTWSWRKSQKHLKYPLKTEMSCFRRIVGNGYVRDCHHKIDLTNTVILKDKLGPNSTWSRRKSQKTPKILNRRIDRNEKVLKLQTGFGSRQCGHFTLSDAC